MPQQPRGRLYAQRIHARLLFPDGLQQLFLRPLPHHAAHPANRVLGCKPAQRHFDPCPRPQLRTPLSDARPFRPAFLQRRIQADHLLALPPVQRAVRLHFLRLRRRNAPCAPALLPSALLFRPQRTQNLYRLPRRLRLLFGVFRPFGLSRLLPTLRFRLFQLHDAGLLQGF